MRVIHTRIVVIMKMHMDIRKCSGCGSGEGGGGGGGIKGRMV